MIATLPPSPDVLATLRARNDQRKAEHEQRYLEFIHAAAAGDEIDMSELETVISAVGRSASDFERHVYHARHRLEGVALWKLRDDRKWDLDRLDTEIVLLEREYYLTDSVKRLAAIRQEFQEKREARVALLQEIQGNHLEGNKRLYINFRYTDPETGEATLIVNQSKRTTDRQRELTSDLEGCRSQWGQMRSKLHRLGFSFVLLDGSHHERGFDEARSKLATMEAELSHLGFDADNPHSSGLLAGTQNRIKKTQDEIKLLDAGLREAEGLAVDIAQAFARIKGIEAAMAQVIVEQSVWTEFDLS
jgi:hypothetical protein